MGIERLFLTDQTNQALFSLLISETRYNHKDELYGGAYSLMDLRFEANHTVFYSSIEEVMAVACAAGVKHFPGFQTVYDEYVAAKKVRQINKSG